MTGVQTCAPSDLPYAATVSVTATVPGQVGTATITVKDSRGKAAQGVNVSLSAKGADVRYKALSTDTRGQAQAAFEPTVLHPYFTATATAPSSSTVWVNTPSRGR